MAASLTGLLLGTTMGLFTVLPITPQNSRTSVGSISGKNESLEIVLRLESGEELRLKATGKTTMEVLTILKKTSLPLAGRISEGRYSQSIPLRDL